MAAWIARESTRHPGLRDDLATVARRSSDSPPERTRRHSRGEPSRRVTVTLPAGDPRVTDSVGGARVANVSDLLSGSL